MPNGSASYYQMMRMAFETKTVGWGARVDTGHALKALVLIALVVGALVSAGVTGHYYQGILSDHEARLYEAEQEIVQAEARVEQLSITLSQSVGAIEPSDELLQMQQEVAELTKALVEEREAAEVHSDRMLTGHILGTSSDGGVVVPVEYELREGEGRVLVNLEGAIFLKDAQDSIKKAHETAKAVSGVKSESTDLIITVLNPFEIPMTLDGPSASATMSVNMVAVMTGKEVRKDVFLTGAIGKEGSIRPVNGIELKAEGARSANATVLLVPKGQKVSAGDLEIIEVSNVAEALEVMLE